MNPQTKIFIDEPECKAWRNAKGKRRERSKRTKLSGRKPQQEIFGQAENSLFETFDPRNNKLSQVTVYLFLGPKGAAVSYSLIYQKKLSDEPQLRTQQSNYF